MAELTDAGITLSGFATIADTTAQIVLGDLEDYEPEVYPSIRVTFPSLDFLGGPTTQTRAAVRFDVAVYVEDTGGPTTSVGVTVVECADDLISDLHQTGIAYVEAVRAVLERELPKSGRARHTLARSIQRIEAPQDPERPCVLRERYILSVEVSARLKQSQGTPRPS